MRILKFLVFVIFCFCGETATAQLLPKVESQVEASTKYIFKLGMGYDKPMKDLAERFGNNLNFHAGLERLSANNWYFNSEFVYRYGDEVAEDVLSEIRLQNGDFLAIDGQSAIVFLRMRGASISINGGKLISLSSKRPQSGIKVGIGINYMSHYIRVLDENQALTQVMGKYSKAYDRLTRGWGLQQYIGYQFMSTDGNLNFNIGFDFVQSFTSAVRSNSFSQFPTKTNDRKDFLSGFKITWLIPIYTDEKGEQIYY